MGWRSEQPEEFGAGAFDRFPITDFAAFDNANGRAIAIIGFVELPCLSITERDPIANSVAFGQGRTGNAFAPVTGEQRAARTLGCHDRRRADTGCRGQQQRQQG